MYYWGIKLFLPFQSQWSCGGTNTTNPRETGRRKKTFGKKLACNGRTYNIKYCVNEIATYRLNRPNSWFSENMLITKRIYMNFVVGLYVFYNVSGQHSWLYLIVFWALAKHCPAESWGELPTAPAPSFIDLLRYLVHQIAAFCMESP